MTSMEELSAELQTLSKEMLEASGDLHQVSQRLINAPFHKGFVGKPSIPAEEAHDIEQGLDEIGKDIMTVIEELVGWAERASPFQIRNSEWDEREGAASGSKYGVVEVPTLHEEVDLALLVSEARAMMRTINSISDVLEKGLHHLGEPDVRALGKSLEHYSGWLQKNGTRLGGNPSAPAAEPS
jgi:hypothetical protein